jgi:glycosyltransferase involved in cell wall biosynthesis
MITLLCSAYNSAKHIDQYLEYVNNQTLHKFEIIFVDANSTDNTLDKIRDYQFRVGITKKVFGADKRIGIYEAWNRAIEHSSYDYVMNYNTDDKLFPSALQIMVDYAQKNPDIDVLYSNSYISQTPDHAPVSFYNWADANVKENLMHGCCCGPYPLLKKSSVVEAGMFDPTFTISGDYELWCRLHALGKTFLKIDEAIGVYYANPEGMSTAQDAKRHQEHIRQDTLIRRTFYESN